MTDAGASVCLILATALIALVRYISPQDCTIKSINSRLDNYLSTLSIGNHKRPSTIKD